MERSATISVMSRGMDDDRSRPASPIARPIPCLAATGAGSWYQAPYICIPATCDVGQVLVVIQQDGWQRILSASDGKRAEAVRAALKRAETAGNWFAHHGEPAILIAS